MEKNRRKTTRVPLTFTVTISLHGQDIPIQTDNISLRGLLCSPDKRLQAGQTCTVLIELNKEVLIKLDATILRASEDDTAIYFNTMDEESFFHLKRLVQYNTDDPDKIDRELAELYERL